MGLVWGYHKIANSGTYATIYRDTESSGTLSIWKDGVLLTTKPVTLLQDDTYATAKEWKDIPMAWQALHREWFREVEKALGEE